MNLHTQNLMQPTSPCKRYTITEICRRGSTASGRVRFSSSFPAESAGFVGTECITSGTGGIFEEEGVDSSVIFDLTAGYQVPNTRATVQLSVNNLRELADSGGFRLKQGFSASSPPTSRCVSAGFCRLSGHKLDTHVPKDMGSDLPV